MILIVLGGKPGSGKTTVANCLAITLGAQRVCLDAVADRLIEEVGFRPDVPELTYQQAASIAHMYLAAGVPTVVDCINPTQASRSCWNGVAEKANCSFLDIELICNFEVAYARCLERTSELINVAPWRYGEVLELAYEVRHNETVTIDTSTTAVGDVAAAIMAEACRNGMFKIPS